jgi:hypothetical protein
MSTGDCTLVTAAECIPPSLWLGNGTLCAPDPCPTSSVDGESQMQSLLRLSATPNPATGDVVIEYYLPSPTAVTIELFTAGGTLVRRIDAGQQTAGRHAVQWDGRDATARPLPSGVYLARLTTRQGSTTARVVVAR